MRIRRIPRHVCTLHRTRRIFELDFLETGSSHKETLFYLFQLVFACKATFSVLVPTTHLHWEFLLYYSPTGQTVSVFIVRARCPLISGHLPQLFICALISDPLHDIFGRRNSTILRQPAINARATTRVFSATPAIEALMHERDAIEWSLIHAEC